MFIDKPARTLTNFTKSVCFEYFKKTLSVLNPLKRFRIPAWIPKFKEPTKIFDMTPPTYKQVTKIVKHVKAKGSPCPLDKVSIICFKRCPFLRTYLTALYAEVFKVGKIPDVWKRAITILIYKKGSDDDPANFRPITLESICLKMYTSLIRDRISSFLWKNGYIERHIQKGFVEGMSGTNIQVI